MEREGGAVALLLDSEIVEEPPNVGEEQIEEKIAALEAKLRKKTEVLAEVVEEPVRTKKRLSGR